MFALTSEFFEIKGSNGGEYWLQFCPMSNDDDYKNDCALNLILKNLNGNKPIEVEYKLWVENIYGQQMGQRKGLLFKETMNTAFDLDTIKVDTIDIGYRDPKFLHLDQLYSEGFVKNDILLICCTVNQVSSNKEDPITEKELREKLFSLYEQGFTGNCTIRVKDESFKRVFNLLAIFLSNKLKVPKNILMAHSAVFECMFTANGLKESETNQVEIKDFEPNVMKAFIKYLHLGQLDKTDIEPIALALFEMANKYLVNHLSVSLAFYFYQCFSMQKTKCEKP
jgi:hypothetical protein